MSPLLETLAAELERPRDLSARVVSYIGETYGIDRDTVGRFLVDELSRLEDYEVDLILSPVFTPKLADQAVFAELLGRDSLPRQQWPKVIQELLARPTQARLVTDDGQTHAVTLREVSIERYVHRLRLEATISSSLFDLIQRSPSITDRPMLKAIARRPVWENDARRNIFERYLAAVIGRGSYSLGEVIELLNLVEGRKPDNIPDLLEQIPLWQQALRQQINVASGPKAFFSTQVQESHGGERDQRNPDDVRLSLKQDELAFLERLRQVLAS